MKSFILTKLRSLLRNIKVLFDLSISIIRVLLYSRRIKKDLLLKLNGKLFILGNGPSLNHVIDENIQFLSTQNILVVNDFFLHHHFELLKPKIYFIADPAYWDTEVPDDLYRVQKQFQENILKKVSWEMYVFIPMDVYQSGYFQNVFHRNSYIKIRPFNLTSFIGPKRIRYFFYDKLLARPLAGNVVGNALFISLHMKVEEIFLFGVEHSWTRNLYVNNLNQTCIKSEHFHDNKSEKVWLKSNGQPYSIDKALYDISIMLGGYEEIRKYAEYKGIKIYNSTPESFIDAFERKKWERNN